MECLAAILSCSLARETYVVHRETFFKIHLHRMNPATVCFGNARSLADTHYEPMSLHTGRLAARSEGPERNTQNFAIPTPRFAWKFSTWNPLSHAGGAYPQNCMVELPRNQVSEMHFDTFSNPSTFFSVGKRASRPRYVLVLPFPRKLCCGSKKW